MGFGEGDIVRVLRPGQHLGRDGAIYDRIGKPNDPWMRQSPRGETEYRVYMGEYPTRSGSPKPNSSS